MRQLIARAAEIEGLPGKHAARAWVVRHYGERLRCTSLEEIPPVLRAQLRTDALRLITAHEDAQATRIV